jgi:hypothetical protein
VHRLCRPVVREAGQSPGHVPKVAAGRQPLHRLTHLFTHSPVQRSAHTLIQMFRKRLTLNWRDLSLTL